MKKERIPQNGKPIRTNAICDKLDFATREAYKRLRTNIQFSFAADESSRVIGVTSSIRGEGKSFTSINLAYTLAQNNKKVVLLDADLRIPTIATKMKMHRTPGLSNVLVGSDTEYVIQRVKFDKNDTSFDIIAAGELPPNPAELLGSARMAQLIDSLKQSYDYIILDLPPVCVVADALIVSQLIDGMIIVVRENYCRNNLVKEAVAHLKFANANIIGFVYNASSANEKSYSKYNKYYRKYYGYEYSNPESYER